MMTGDYGARCANRQYTDVLAGSPPVRWTVGPVANANGTLVATRTQLGVTAWNCQGR